MTWAKSASEATLKKLINENKSDELHLCKLLHKHGYSATLDGIKFDGHSWKGYKIIDLSNLSLRNCQLINITCDKILFNKSDLHGAIINISLANVDFSDSNLDDAYIQKPISGNVIFKNAELDGAAIVSGAGLSTTLTPEQYDQIIHIQIEPDDYFNQDSITKEYKNLSKLGVCNGLAMDFARHILLYNKADYVDKLKSMVGTHCEGFAQSVSRYQEDLQPSDICSANETAIKIGTDGFLTSLPDNLKTSNILGFTVKGHLGAHIITVARMDNGYVIFDPNIGKIDCTKQTPEENICLLDQQIVNLYKLYHKKMLAFGKIKVSDLEAVIKEAGIREITGRRIRKYSMSGLYCLMSLFFCLVFIVCFNFTDNINEIAAVVLSIAFSFLISGYMAYTISSFYKKHLSHITLQEL